MVFLAVNTAKFYGICFGGIIVVVFGVLVLLTVLGLGLVAVVYTIVGVIWVVLRTIDAVSGTRRAHAFITDFRKAVAEKPKEEPKA